MTETTSRTTESGPSSGPARQALGAYGERVAAAYLTACGMVLAERNWRCPDGELDLVLWDGEVLVVCEVKTRAGETGGTPHEAVTPEKLQRIQRLAEQWQLAHGVRAEDLRVDLVAVVHPPRGAAEVEHVRGLV
ncbi:YraN family protein [Nocardioides sp. SOB44]|jgi:putative endonuclease|uniref:UPF0102 protein QWJ41_09950 n=1 Tax=Nocardioides cremeus TaxID=3058044 RepID=A0ABT8TQD1_9ACTN|nr:YraN family protein [Nocardioides cremeus]MDO3396041.1 YraN family protein [Nocardioides cremeus]